jgi:hypothetical protein
MRDFNILVPSDCVVSNTKEENEHALEQIKKVLKAGTRPPAKLDFDAAKGAAKSDGRRIIACEY